jgi:hypothetical protein
MAGKYGSASAVFIVDGYNVLLMKLKGLSLKIRQITERSDGLGDNYQAFAPVGKYGADISQSGGFYDTSSGSGHAAFATSTPTTPQTAARIGIIGVMGQITGAVAYGIAGMFSVAYEVLHEDSKLTKANVDWQVSGQVERGMIVQPLATKTADWDTDTLNTETDYLLDPSQYDIPITSSSVANPTVITTPNPHGITAPRAIFISGHSGSTPTMNGSRTATPVTATTFTAETNVTVGGTGGSFIFANSLDGAAGYQEVTAFSGFTGYVGKLRDSPDNVTFADLLTFANVTSAPNAQRITVTGTVDRYVVHNGDVTGTGSVTVMSMVARL